MKGRSVSLLVEVGTEEIPAQFLTPAAREFGARLEAFLRANRLLEGQPQGMHEDVGASTSLSAQEGAVETYSSPRRLVALVPALLPVQPDQVEVVTGPPIRVAFDAEGKPTRAAESFAEKNRVPPENLPRLAAAGSGGDLGSALVGQAAFLRQATPKGEYLALRRTSPGKPALEVLTNALGALLWNMSFPKSMYWEPSAGPQFKFVRPIRWLLALLGEGKKAQIIHFAVPGVRSGNRTFGHRSYSRGPIPVTGFKDYRKKLAKACVEIGSKERHRKIQQRVKVILEKSQLRVVEDRDLEDWLVNSTEWPGALVGEFDPRFLKLPREILMTVMRGHQKYFGVEDREGRLQPRFVAVMNLASDPKGFIRRGHERVLQARFRDAEFFWEVDQRRPLRDRTETLKNVTYREEIGTYAEKVERMLGLAKGISESLEAAGRRVDAESLLHAVRLAKCDLTTQMVQEFPELQGIVGGLYARAQGESAEVADAIYDQYLPIGLEDRVPRTLEGALVSLADKLDSVVAGFAVGQAPTGSSDPFALRRQANGIVKLLLEVNLPFQVKLVVQHALAQLDVNRQIPRDKVFRELMEFFSERLAFFLETARGLRYDTVKAVVAAGWDVPTDALARATALERIRGSEDFEALSVAAKRIKNILSKSASSADWSPGDVNGALLGESAERALFDKLATVSSRVEAWATTSDYSEALGAIATLRPAVDLFFDKVLVMDPDPALRQNRLRLLARLDNLFSGIAHFALMAGESKR